MFPFWHLPVKGGLCGLLHALAEETWHLLKRSHASNLQPGEETLTDLLVLALAEAPRHGLDLPQIKVRAHSKYEEGKHGGDWDLWVVQDGRGVGIRFQAKVYETKSQRFNELHYLSGETKSSQADKLIKGVDGSTMIPLYLLYQAWTKTHQSPHIATVGTRAHGCSLLDPLWVKDNISPGHGADLGLVAPHEHPWELLFCGLDGGPHVPDSMIERLRGAGLVSADDGPSEAVSIPDEVRSLLQDRFVEPFERPTVAVEVAAEVERG